MNNNTQISLLEPTSFEKVKGYVKLLKFRLSFVVTFSGAMVYLLASNNFDIYKLLLFSIGGFCVTASANIINQLKEINYDRLMARTMNRPLPTGILTNIESIVFCFLLGLIGVFIHLFYFNIPTAILSFVSLFLYGFVYTPLKRVGPIAVFVGAFPGAFPPLIGWLAATGNLMDPNAWILFGIQFIWQFPHFWAVAWVVDEDYQKAGFKLLPFNGKKDINTAFTIMTYTLFLIPLSLLPMFFGLTGKTSAIIVTIAGVMFLYQTFLLMKRCDRKTALKIMFASFIYLPIVQIAYVLDKNV